MIPERAEIEAFYDARELSAIDMMRKVCSGIVDEKERNENGRAFLRAIWPDELEYISKTVWISTKSKGMRLLKPNYAQVKLYDDVIRKSRLSLRPIRAILLKGRQLGFSTFIQAWQYEQCERNAHRKAMTLSFDDPSTVELFEKTKTIHHYQWFPRELMRGRSNLIEFGRPHSSTFYTRTAGTSSAGRSFTVHHLHCSEVPMWPDPEGVMTSVQQAVPADPMTSIIWESTAKGAQGLFYEVWKDAMSGESDFIPFFAPWFWDPEYALPFASDDHRRKFMATMRGEDLEYMRLYRLSAEQMAWREWKTRNDLNGSPPLFQQEYPACAQEAFLTTGSPVFNPKAIQKLYENIAKPRFVGDIVLTSL